jgi:hypothetical protein
MLGAAGTRALALETQDSAYSINGETSASRRHHKRVRSWHSVDSFADLSITLSPAAYAGFALRLAGRLGLGECRCFRCFAGANESRRRRRPFAPYSLLRDRWRGCGMLGAAGAIQQGDSRRSERRSRPRPTLKQSRNRPNQRALNPHESRAPSHQSPARQATSGRSRRAFLSSTPAC